MVAENTVHYIEEVMVLLFGPRKWEFVVCGILTDNEAEMIPEAEPDNHPQVPSFMPIPIAFHCSDELPQLKVT